MQATVQHSTLRYREVQACRGTHRHCLLLPVIVSRQHLDVECIQQKFIKGQDHCASCHSLLVCCLAVQEDEFRSLLHHWVAPQHAGGCNQDSSPACCLHPPRTAVHHDAGPHRGWGHRQHRHQHPVWPCEAHIKAQRPTVFITDLRQDFVARRCRQLLHNTRTTQKPAPHRHNNTMRLSCATQSASCISCQVYTQK